MTDKHKNSEDLRMTHQAKARPVFLSAIVLLGACAVATYLSFLSFRTGERLVSHTYQVRALIGDLDTTINNASRARMSYLLSGDEGELKQYRSAASRALDEIDALQGLTADNPVQLGNCERLESMTRNRLQVWEQAIVEKQQGRSVDMAGLVAQNVDFAGKSAVAMAEIRDVEARLLAQRMQAAHMRFRLAKALVGSGFALALFLLWFYYRLLSRELAVRERSEHSAHEAYLREVVFRQDEQRFRIFIQAVRDYAIFTLDAQGHVSSWNEGAQRLKGYAAPEIIGRHFSCFYPAEDVEAGKPQRELEIAIRDGRVEDEGWRVRKDGSSFWANVIITAIRDNAGRLIGFVKVTRDYTDRMQAEDALKRANADLLAEAAERKSAENRLANSEKSLRDLSLHLLRTQDEERKRIGRDLHDSLGQYLAVLKMNLDSLDSVLGSNHNGAAEQVALCIRLADDAIKEVRTISYLLYPPLLEEMGLRSAILWYLDGFSQRSNIQTTFDADLDFGRMAPEVELALFRILQESLTNVHRHSGSTTANVRLFKSGGKVVLEIKDSGKGMPPELLQHTQGDWTGSLGVGLRGMNERVGQLGGNFEVLSSGKGTVIRATVPVDDPVASLTRTA
jgi:PAS domain S-box-containing protein